LYSVSAVGSTATLPSASFQLLANIYNIITSLIPPINYFTAEVNFKPLVYHAQHES